MEEHNIKICRLCLSILENENFEVLAEWRAEMLGTLLNNFNPFASYNPIICGNCNNNLQKCYDFKMMCLNNQDCAKTFININDPLKVNLEDIRELFEDGKRLEGKKMCRLCVSVNSGYFANMNEVIEDKSVGNMLMSCIPELNLDMTNESSICQPCIYLLQRQLTFMQHCLKLEEKINLYYKLKCKGNYDIVDLYDVRQFFEKMPTEDSSERNILTQENESNPPPEVAFIKVENVELKVEENSEIVDTFRKEENMNLQSPAVEESNNTGDEQINSKSDITNSDKRFKCSKCSYTAKYKSALKDHFLIHKSPSEITMYQCTTCGRQIKRRRDFNKHMMIHKNPSELQMFKCTICTYESRRKKDLKMHMYTHSTEPFKCKYCPFESKFFQAVTRHMRTHKRISCKFATHSMDNLRKHIVVHKDIPEKKTFTCYTCNSKYKRKQYLIWHMQIHNNPSEVYRCEQCSYSTKIPRNLNIHIKRQHSENSLELPKLTFTNLSNPMHP